MERVDRRIGERGRDGDYVAKGRRLGIITLNGINRILHPTSPLS